MERRRHRVWSVPPESRRKDIDGYYALWALEPLIVGERLAAEP
jgi:hypothetical protein